MLMTIYKRVLAVLLRKPLKLWGISLLAVLLMIVGAALCGVAIPALALVVVWLLGTSMTMVFLAGYRGEEIKTTQLFSCFKDWNTIKRVSLGLGWQVLWTFLWSLIPVVGPIFAVIRNYEYRLTAYILILEPDVPITEAIHVSKQRTKGYKLKMWLSEVLVGVAIAVVALLLMLLGKIPYVGVLFTILMVLFMLCAFALLPLAMGLLQSAFYEEITNPTLTLAKAVPTVNCPACGHPQAEGSKFCSDCGQPM